MADSVERQKKYSGYSPNPRTLPPSPGKPYNGSKLKVGSYGADGRGSAFKQAPRQYATTDIVRFRDVDGE